MRQGVGRRPLLTLGLWLRDERVLCTSQEASVARFLSWQVGTLSQECWFTLPCQVGARLALCPMTQRASPSPL